MNKHLKIILTSALLFSKFAAATTELTVNNNTNMRLNVGVYDSDNSKTVVAIEPGRSKTKTYSDNDCPNRIGVGATSVRSYKLANAAPRETIRYNHMIQDLGIVQTLKSYGRVVDFSGTAKFMSVDRRRFLLRDLFNNDGSLNILNITVRDMLKSPEALTGVSLNIGERTTVNIDVGDATTGYLLIS